MSTAYAPATSPIATLVDLAAPTMDLEALAPISLDDLVTSASRLTRVDRKYVVPRRLLPTLLQATAGRAKVLDIDGVRDFAYRTVYLDTLDVQCFRAAGQKRRRRAKIRTRSYLDSGATFLEVKTRGPRGTTVKERIEHPDVEEAGLTAAGAAFIADRLAAAQIDTLDVASLVPMLSTTYRRSTLALGPDRVTIDTVPGWTALGPAQGDLDRPGLAIVETKAGATPTLVDHALWRLGHRPIRISKYGSGLAAVRPELPHLKWHRVINQHLRPHSSATIHEGHHS